MSGAGLVAFIVGLAVAIAIAGSSLLNKEELNRYQELKNKRRLGGKRLSPDDQAEYDKLVRKYWWH